MPMQRGGKKPTVKAAEITTLGKDGTQVYYPTGPRLDPLAPTPKELIELTPEKAEYICREIAKGRSLVSICEAEDMPHMSTFLRRCQSDVELQEKYYNSKKARAHIRVEQVESLTEDLDPKTTEKTEAYVADIKARNLVRLAEIGDPATFSPKLQMQHSGNLVNITLDLSNAQSRPESATTIDQVPEKPRIESPSVGIEASEAGGGRGVKEVESPGEK